MTVVVTATTTDGTPTIMTYRVISLVGTIAIAMLFFVAAVAGVFRTTAGLVSSGVCLAVLVAVVTLVTLHRSHA